MYSTFKANAPSSENSRPPKPKRAQVTRACVACRVARAKCDTVRPCRNCEKSGRECVSSGAASTTSQRPASAQIREIDRLRAKVQQLEEQANRQQHTPQTTPPTEGLHATHSHPDTCNWRGIAVNGLQYGPISDQAFCHRLSLAVPQLDVFPPKPPTGLLNSSTVDLRICDRLERSQQDYFFDLFWLSYHINFPALDEADFRNLYASLWHDERTRDPDPLVDIILALKMQYAFSYLGEDGSAGEEAAVAGKAFYHRCQAALSEMSETPSTKAVQCIFFSAVYLSFARCYNAAHTMVKTAGNMLKTLSTDALDPAAQGLHARLYRCISTQNIRLSFKLGRFEPTQATLQSSLAQTPEEFDHLDFEGSPYHIHLLRLCCVAHSIYNNFIAAISPLLVVEDTFHTSPAVRDQCAAILATEMKALDDWVSQVPASLKTPRLSGSQPFSTDRSKLNFLDSEQQWLQRQRLALECQYHAFCITLLRPFINFSPTSVKGTFNADSNCIRCVNHAVTLSSVISQGMRETDILKGCYQAFEWQQDATYALAAFALAYPVCPPTPGARKILVEAGQTFGCFGKGKPAAVRMGILAKEFDGKVKERMAKFRGVMDHQLTPADSVGRDQHQNIDPTLQEAGLTALGELSPSALPSVWSSGVYESQLWPMDTPGSLDVWSSFMGDLGGHQGEAGV